MASKNRTSVVPLMRREYVGFNGVLGHLIEGPSRGTFPIWHMTESRLPNKVPGITIDSKVAVFKTLVERHGNYPTLLDETGYSRLHLICSVHSPGQVEVLKVLCSANRGSVNVLDYMHRTPLHHALSPENLKYHIKSEGGFHLVPLIKELINLGANVNTLDIHGFSPLHLALDVYDAGYAGQLLQLPSIIEMFIVAGADVSQVVQTHIWKYGIVYKSTAAEDDVLYSDHTTMMHLACCMKGPQSVEAMRLLLSPENASCRDSHRRTPLHSVVGCLGKTLSTPRLLLDDGPVIPEEDLVLSKLTLLFDLGADVNAMDVEGATPLCMAVRKHKFNICLLVIRVLIDKGAIANFRFSGEGITPMHLLCQHFDLFLPCLLPDFLKAGGQINAMDYKRQTPIHIALKNPPCSVDTVKCLYNVGADVTATDAEGLNCLHIVCGHQDATSRRVVKFLVKKGCCINGQNLEGDTPLHLSLHHCLDKKFIKTLIDCGADVNIKNNNGITALLMVYQSSGPPDYELVELIVRSGADVNSTDCSNTTPLFHEIVKDRNNTFSNMSTVKLLLVAGADPNIGNSAGVRPLHIACTRKDDALTELLLEFGADVNLVDAEGFTPLHCAVRNSWDQWRYHPNDQIVEIIVKRGANINAEDSSNKTPLQHEIQKSGLNLRTVHLLLVAGADPNVGSDAKPLHIAASHGNPSLTKLLLDFGANVNLVDSCGLTPLHRAASATKGNPNKTLMFLIDGGADPSKKDKCNCTALMSLSNMTSMFFIPYIAIMMSTERYSTSEEEENYFACRGASSYAATLFTDCVKNAPLMNKIPIGRTTLAEFLLEPPDRTRLMLRNPEIIFNLHSARADPSFTRFEKFIVEKLDLLFHLNDLNEQALSCLISLFRTTELPVLVCEQILSYLTEQDLISLSCSTIA